MKDEIPIWGFNNREKMDGIPNNVFLLVRVTEITNFEVSRVMVEKGILCEIVYAKLFEKLV